MKKPEPYDPYPPIAYERDGKYHLANGREVPLIQLVVAYNELADERRARQETAS